MVQGFDHLLSPKLQNGYRGKALSQLRLLDISCNIFHEMTESHLTRLFDTARGLHTVGPRWCAVYRPTTINSAHSSTCIPSPPPVQLHLDFCGVKCARVSAALQRADTLLTELSVAGGKLDDTVSGWCGLMHSGKRYSMCLCGIRIKRI